MNFVFSMLVYSAFALPFIVLIRCIANLHLEHKGIRCNIFHSVGSVLWGVCIVALLSQTIVPNMELGFDSVLINWIPFYTVWDYFVQAIVNHNVYYLIINLFGNVLLFVPFGLFPCLLWKRARFKGVLLLSFATSLAIELIQLVQPDRTTDIDDILLNVFGGIVGYWIYKLVNRYFPKFTGKFKLEAPKHFSEAKQEIRKFKSLAQ